MSAEMLIVNPAKKKRVRRNPPRRKAAAKTRRRRTTRSLTLKNSVNEVIVPGAIGGAGAVAVRHLYKKLPLPANMKTGFAGDAAQVAIAVLAAFGLSKTRLVSAKQAIAFGTGAVAVSVAGAATRMMNRSAPGAPAVAGIMPNVGEIYTPGRGIGYSGYELDAEGNMSGIRPNVGQMPDFEETIYIS